MRIVVAAFITFTNVGAVLAQVPPSAAETAAYTGLLAAAARGDAAEITRMVATGNAVDQRDAYGRTPLHVAAYRAGTMPCGRS
jgi:ankyrin repeat protein